MDMDVAVEVEVEAGVVFVVGIVVYILVLQVAWPPGIEDLGRLEEEPGLVEVVANPSVDKYSGAGPVPVVEVAAVVDDTWWVEVSGGDVVVDVVAVAVGRKQRCGPLQSTVTRR